VNANANILFVHVVVQISALLTSHFTIHIFVINLRLVIVLGSMLVL
jgi:hypothetical protein